MAAVTYKGTTIPFGHVSARPHEVDLKTWSFPGVDGLDVLAMGIHGRAFLVSGRSANGGISKSTIEGFVNTTGVLVTAGGTNYSDCYCVGAAFPKHYTDQDGSAFTFRLALLQTER